MPEFLPLSAAVSSFVRDGDKVALEGFTHLIPHAAGQEIIRQGKTDLTLIRMTPDIISDWLIGVGCARKLVFSWGGNPGVGSLHRFRDAVENKWPKPLEIVEHSHAATACAYEAGASGMPFAVLRAYQGTDHRRVNAEIKPIVCPFTGEELIAVPAIRPDVTIIHAQRADRAGNVQVHGIMGVQKEAVLAATKAVVTVEEIVDKLPDVGNSTVIPAFVIDAVCEVPFGAYPSYALGYYRRDNSFYLRWDEVSRTRETFTAWIKKFVLDVADWSGTWALLKSEGYL